MEPPFPAGPDPKIRRVWLLRGILWALALVPTLGWVFALPLGFGLEGLGVPAPFAFAAPWALMVVGVAVGLLVWVPMAHRRLSFAIDAQSVRIQRGILFRTARLVPMRRIQEVEVRDGPLLRRRGLATLRLRVALPGEPTTGYGEPTLPGVADGHRVAAALMERVQALRGDV